MFVEVLTLPVAHLYAKIHLPALKLELEPAYMLLIINSKFNPLALLAGRYASIKSIYCASGELVFGAGELITSCLVFAFATTFCTNAVVAIYVELSEFALVTLYDALSALLAFAACVALTAVVAVDAAVL